MSCPRSMLTVQGSTGMRLVLLAWDVGVFGAEPPFVAGGKLAPLLGSLPFASAGVASRWTVLHVLPAAREGSMLPDNQAAIYLCEDRHTGKRVQGGAPGAGTCRRCLRRHAKRKTAIVWGAD